MPEKSPKDPAPRKGSEDANPPAERQSLTPELRRFLNTPRATPAAAPSAQKPAEAKPVAPAPTRESVSPPRAEVKPPPKPTAAEQEVEKKAPAQTERNRPAPLQQAERASRTIEMQHAVLIVGGLLLLFLTFYVGTKFNYLKYLIFSQHQSSQAEKVPDRYPGIAAGDLVNQALQAQKEGRWQEAVERLMAAKAKDLRYRGILHRVGSILYDHQQYEAADKACQRAITFGENVDMANFYRGLIAAHRKDLQSTEQYFRAAATAAPFLPDYQYYCGESFRLDLKPVPAIPYYEKAALLARKDQDSIVCQFKIRMARIEAAEGETVQSEVEKKAAAGPLSVDWLMTSAALQLRAGHVEEARAASAQARDGKAPGLFASCASDLYFQEAVKKFAELKDVLHLDLDLQVPFPN